MSIIKKKDDLEKAILFCYVKFSDYFLKSRTV